MAKSGIYGLAPFRLQEFSGLNTLIDPTNLPPYSSPDCQDVQFLPGLVKTRPGLTNQYPNQVVVGTFTGMATYVLPDETTKRFLAFSGRTFYKDESGVLTSISDLMTDGDYMNIAPAFSREYMAFGDGKHGVDIPRAYDDTNFDRVSQIGPGAGPTGVTQTSFTIDTLTRTANIVDVVMTEPFDVSVGDAVSIQANPDPSYNGTFIVCSVTDSTHFSIYAVAVGAVDCVMTRSSGTVTAIIPTNGIIDGAGVSIGSDFVVTSADDPSYNGRFTVLTVDDITNTLTWTQAGPDSATPDGAITFLYAVSGISLGYYVSSLVADGTTATVQLSSHVILADAVFYEPTIAPGVTMDSVLPSPFDGPQTAITGDFTGYTFASAAPAQTLPILMPYASWMDIPDGTSSGGTIAGAGKIVAGVHQVAVSWITRNGFISKPSPPLEFVAIGNQNATITGIPVPSGLDNVVARLLMFTPTIIRPATAGPFYTIENSMRIDDNTLTEWTVNFTDDELIAGTLQDSLFDLVELGEVAGVLPYASRIFWWGQRSKIQNFENLTFDGGFNDSPNYPLGWMPDPTSFAGGSRTADGNAVFGAAYQITGNGASVCGLITQTAFQDYLKDQILLPSTPYSVRVKIKKSTGLVSGVVHVELYSTTSGGTILPGISIAPNVLSDSEWLEFIAPITNGFAPVPSDAVIRVYADGIPTNGESFYLDNIEPFQTTEPYDGSVVVVSNVESPDTYNGVTGFLQRDPGDGQEVRNCFSIRDFLYIVKQRKMYVTQDDGANEPALWDIREVSNKVGTLSSRGVGVGEEWVIIAGREGVYYFDGGAPNKISQEIQPTWDALNWNFGHLIEVTVDTKRKRVYIGVPYAGSTTNNRILTLDYTEGFGDPSAHKGSGRKWSPWAIASGSIDLIQVDDGTLQIFIGRDGIVDLLDEAAFSDDGVAINSYWQSAFFQDVFRLMFGYLSANVTGSGSLSTTMKRGGQNDVKYIRPWALNDNGFANMERRINYVGQRMAILFGTNAVDEHFSLQGISVLAEPATWSPIRGINSNA